MSQSGIKIITLVSMIAAVAGSSPPNTFRGTAALVPVPKSKSRSFQNWGLFTRGKTRADIRAPEAWKIEKGSRDVVVAVIDTGIDPTHPDLRANLWHDRRYPKVFGYDYVRNAPGPLDRHGHGTHVAGIIGATYNGQAGTSGVSQRVSIMAIRYYSRTASGAVNLARSIKGLRYAIRKGAHVINYSGGGPDFSVAEYNALREAESKGILVVAAAGNNGKNSDLPPHHYFPAAYSLPRKGFPALTNILTVAATDRNNRLIPSSNWGKKVVDVAAPGVDIKSTYPGNAYSKMTGTSQATAFVAGISALLLAKDRSLSPQEIKRIIRGSVDRNNRLLGARGSTPLASSGRVNAYSALLRLAQKRLTIAALKKVFDLDVFLNPSRTLYLDPPPSH